MRLGKDSRRDRRIESNAIRFRPHIELPANPRDRVAAVEEESIPNVGLSRWIEIREESLASAIREEFACAELCEQSFLYVARPTDA